MATTTSFWKTISLCSTREGLSTFSDGAKVAPNKVSLNKARAITAVFSATFLASIVAVPFLAGYANRIKQIKGLLPTLATLDSFVGVGSLLGIAVGGVLVVCKTERKGPTVYDTFLSDMKDVLEGKPPE